MNWRRLLAGRVAYAGGSAGRTRLLRSLFQPGRSCVTPACPVTMRVGWYASPERAGCPAHESVDFFPALPGALQPGTGIVAVASCAAVEDQSGCGDSGLRCRARLLTAGVRAIGSPGREPSTSRRPQYRL